MIVVPAVMAWNMASVPMINRFFIVGLVDNWVLTYRGVILLGNPLVPLTRGPSNGVAAVLEDTDSAFDSSRKTAKSLPLSDL